MLGKWWWRFRNEPNALWCKVIKSLHGKEGGLNNFSTISSSNYGTWYRITHLKTELLNLNINLPSLYMKKVHNGESTRFWLDHWVGVQPLKDMFNRLFLLESCKDCLVKDRFPTFAPLLVDFVENGTHTEVSTQFMFAGQPARIGSLTPHRYNSVQTEAQPIGPSFYWNWRRVVRSGAEQAQLIEIEELLGQFRLSVGNDIWVCLIDESHIFSVKSLREYIIHKTPTTNHSLATRWNKISPGKTNILMWRISLERLPTRVNLDKRGVDLDSVLSPSCDDDLETELHLFGGCCVAKDLWISVLKWWCLGNLDLESLLAILTSADLVLIPKQYRVFFDVVLHSTISALWRYRNEKVFSTEKPKQNLLCDVKLSSFTWITSRCKKATFNWIEWYSNPCSALSTVL